MLESVLSFQRPFSTPGFLIDRDSWRSVNGQPMPRRLYYAVNRYQGSVMGPPPQGTLALPGKWGKKELDEVLRRLVAPEPIIDSRPHSQIPIKVVRGVYHRTELGSLVLTPHRLTFARKLDAQFQPIVGGRGIFTRPWTAAWIKPDPHLTFPLASLSLTSVRKARAGGLTSDAGIGGGDLWVANAHYWTDHIDGFYDSLVKAIQSASRGATAETLVSPSGTPSPPEQTASPSTAKGCIMCGKPIPARAKFCPFCREPQN